MILAEREEELIEVWPVVEPELLRGLKYRTPLWTLPWQSVVTLLERHKLVGLKVLVDFLERGGVACHRMSW